MSQELSTARASALYIGALLGPGLLLLPGLAARIAGPASVLAWCGLLVLSALFAVVFTGFGVRFQSSGGVAAYAAAGLGPAAGRAVGWCFLSGVVVGAPVVCLIGAGYVASVAGLGRAATIGVAAVLLALILVITMTGTRFGSGVQLGLVGVLIALIAVAVLGSAGHGRSANWTPFAPHGWTAVGSAAAVLMLSFVGWEAIAPMTGRLTDPARQLPRVIGAAFGVTAVVYLALAGATISVLGTAGGGSAPIAELLRSAVGPAGRPVAAVAAVALTFAAVNAYVSGAVELARRLRPAPAERTGRGVQVAIAGTGIAFFAAAAGGLVTSADLVTVPTTLFVTTYLGCLLSGVRVLTGAARVAAAAGLPAVCATLGFSGRALVVAGVIVAAAILDEIRRNRTQQARNPLLKPMLAVGSVSATSDHGTECGAPA